jgi:hypothetical protein
MPVPEIMFPAGDADTFAAADLAVRKSFLVANERHDARERGEAYHEDVENAVLRHLRLGYGPTESLRRALIDFAGDPTMQRGILGLVGEKIRMLYAEVREGRG